METRESDADVWERMLLLQMEYRCYKSARLEAAVTALEMGVGIEEVPVRKFTHTIYTYAEDLRLIFL